MKEQDLKYLRSSDSASASNSDPSPSAVRRPPFTSPNSPSAVHRPPLTNPARPPVAQLRWRCRRGMRELDVVLERYLQQRYATAPLAEQRAFEALLELPDPQLFGFLLRRETPADPEWVNVVSQLAAFEP